MEIGIIADLMFKIYWEPRLGFGDLGLGLDNTLKFRKPLPQSFS